MAPPVAGVKKTAKFAALSVSVPPQRPTLNSRTSQSYKDVEHALRREPLTSAADVEAVRIGWISAPCDCFLSIWAVLGEAVEGGAEQIVGLMLLPLSGILYYASDLQARFVALTTPEGAEASPPAPPAHPDLAQAIFAASADYALVHPVRYLLLDLGGLLVVGLLVLYEGDLQRLYHTCRQRARAACAGSFCCRCCCPCCAPPDGAYKPLGDAVDTPMPLGGGGGVGRFGAKPIRLMREGTLKRELHKAIDATEELEFKLRVQRGSEELITPDQMELAADDALAAVVQQEEELRQQQLRRSKLQNALAETTVATSPETRARPTAGATRWSRFMSSTFVTVFKRALNGLVTVWLYFADVISDIEVMLLLHSAGKLIFAYLSAALLVVQFLIVWRRVLPYLASIDTRAKDSPIYRFFLYFGFPFGMIGLDFLMFLEPFGLLPVVPIGWRMRQFIPAYKSTRIITEVFVESLPQCLLQSFILLTVTSHMSHGTLTPSEQMLLGASIDGSTFEQILPRSIAISTITSLKAWIELVYSAREAGITVRTKAVQLLNVGFGLPLDALKRGTITQWPCTYEVEDSEVSPLLDALVKNSSLVWCNLSGAKLDWSGPDANPQRSAAPLVEAMAENPAALAELQQLIVCAESQYEIPVGDLRKGGTYALAALNRTAFLQPGGPRVEEILLMGDLLRKNRRRTAVDARDVEASATAVMSILEAAKRREVSAAEWEERLKSMMVSGDMRRAHMKSLVAAEALHDVGFDARDLLEAGFASAELKAGGFTAEEMRDTGRYSNAELKALGYGPRELRAASLRADELRALSYAAGELYAVGFTAAELRDARYTLAQLREAACGVAELKEADYRAAELRAAGFSAPELRKSKAFTMGEMRDAGYSASELRDAGCSALQAKNAGYDAAEVTRAGYGLEHLKGAGYKAEQLRQAGHGAKAMRAAGFDLDALRWAGYQADQLQDAGFDAAELKENGYGLFQLKMANTPVATLKEAGYKADRLKLQGYTAAELAQGGYTAKELRGFKDSLYANDEKEGYAGYTAKELREGHVQFSAAELKAGGYTESELREGGWTAEELRQKGYSCLELKAGGFTASELKDGGYSVQELRDVGHSAAALRAIEIAAHELRSVGYRVSELRKGGFPATELAAAGWGAAELRDGGYGPADLIRTGCGPAVLKAIGYSAEEMGQAGFTAKELSKQGFARHELAAGGFDERAVHAVSSGTPVDKLKADGFSAAELRQFGFAAAELRAGGYTCKEMKQGGGYTFKELRDGGFKERTVDAVNGRPVKTLRTKGYTAKELSAIGFRADELIGGGFTAKDLKEIGYAAEALKAASCSTKQLREAGFTSKVLRAAGFSLRELREGGSPWNELVIFMRCTHAELVEAGYEGIDPKDMLFKQYRPE